MSRAYKYVRATVENKEILGRYPSAGPYANITGMRKFYWGMHAYIVRCGAFIYNVPYDVFVALD